MTFLSEDKILSMVNQIFIDLQNSNMLQLWSKLPIKIKRYEHFTVNYDTQKLTFWKTFAEKSFSGKKLMM